MVGTCSRQGILAEIYLEDFAKRNLADCSMGKFGRRHHVLKIFLDKTTHLRIIWGSDKDDYMESFADRHSHLLMGMPFLFLGG